MLTSYLRLAALVLIAFVVSGCQERLQPIYNSSNVPIPASLATTSLEDIGNGIKQAGAIQNWKMTDTGPGKIEGVFNIRTHQATVQIDYSLLSYSIIYVSSINLLNEGGSIHRNYNKWVRDLESTINVTLLEKARILKNQSLNPNDIAMLEAWRKVQASDNPLVLQDFMDKYQGSPFASAAQDQLNRLAEERVSGIRRYDPTGNWQVTVRYLRGADNIGRCPRSGRWVFIYNFAKGKISQTFWDSGLPLYVSSQNYDDFVDLKLTGPADSGDFQWTDRFIIDSDEQWFEAKAEGVCPGTMKLYMKKVDTVGSASKAPTSTSTYSGRYDPTGNWQVTVRYVRGADNLSNCPRSGRWSFVLIMPRGEFSETHWDGNLPLYIEGKNSDNLVDLNLNGPLYSGEFKWADRFVIDSNEGRFEATANGVCPGAMKLHMKRQ